MSAFADNITTCSEINKVHVGIVGHKSWIAKRFIKYSVHADENKIFRFQTIDRQLIGRLKRNPDLIRETLLEHDVKYIINFATGDYFGIRNQICKNQTKSWASDFELPRLLVNSVKDTDITIIHLSTGDVFDIHTIPSFVDTDASYTEKDLCNAVFQNSNHAPFFPSMKFLSEQIIRMHDKHYIFRIKNPLDVDLHPKSLLGKLMTDNILPNVEESVTFLPDLFSAMLFFMSSTVIPHGIYHCVHPEIESCIQVAKAFKKHLNKLTRYSNWDFNVCSVNEYLARLNTVVSFSKLDASKLHSCYGLYIPFADIDSTCMSRAVIH